VVQDCVPADDRSMGAVDEGDVMEIADGFRSIESELRKRREQADSVRGKDTPFRVVFSYEGGTKHYQYFLTADDAMKAQDSMCLYGPTGNPIIRLPRTRHLEVRGPRGGWNRIIGCCGV